jgi:chromosome segregation ATPase
MKQIYVRKITLKNFKGAKDLVIGVSTHMRFVGPNESRKTTVLDGFTWVLTDKDSLGRKQFDIKPLDERNQVIHGLSPDVTVELRVDGKPIVLRKVFSEKWTKKRGSALEEFTGHTTDYYIDGVPVKQKEYQAFIDSLVSEELLKLLTNPMHFNEQLSWQDRRRLLLEVCGDVTDDEVIQSNQSLSSIPTFLEGRSIDDHRKVVKAQMAQVNKDLEKIPVRIDEVSRSKPETDGLNEIELQTDIEGLKSKIADKEAEQTRLQSGGEVAEKEKRLREVEGELLQIKNAAQSDVMDQITVQRRNIADAELKVDTTGSLMQSRSRAIAGNEELINELRRKVEKLRDDWVTENETELAETGVVDTCPSCGQALPETDVQAAIEKARAHFNQHKAEQLETITQKAVEAKNRIAELETTNEQLQATIQSLETQHKEAQQVVTDAKTHLDELQSQVTDPTKSLEYRAKELERQAVVNKIAGLRQSVLDDVNRVRNELMDLRDELRRKETLLAQFEQVRKLDDRIEELKQQERALAAEYERLSQQLYLLEEFTRAKVAMLEDKINSKFKYARFKLFTEQINGGLTETCETLYKGVSYSGGLNTGGKILVGLDILETLQKHFGYSLPVWVDNRESLTSPIELDSQLIELVADPTKKKLEIEDLEQEAV